MYRCPDCRTRRKDYGLFAQHLRTSGHKVCDCGGYHYRHRPGSPYCKANPMSVVRHALREWATDEQALELEVEVTYSAPGKPFNRWY